MDVGKQLNTVTLYREPALRHTYRLALCTVLALSAGGTSAAEDGPAPFMQAFIGSLQLDDQTAQWDEIGDEQADVEFPSAIPSGGIEAEYTYGDNRTWRWGINSGGSIAWKSSDTRISGGVSGENGAVIRFDIDNSLFIGELHLGAFVRAGITKKVSVYAAAGPMLMYGKHEVEDEDVETPEPTANGQVIITDSEDSDFDVGYYGRAGIDYRYARGQRVGLGVRYMEAEMDFSDTVGKLDVAGPQIVLTYTATL